MTTTTDAPAQTDGSEAPAGPAQAAWLAVVTVVAFLALILAALALWLATDDDDGGGGGADGAAASGDIEVDGGDFFFDPDSSTAAAGTAVGVTFNNVGAVPHDWVVLELGTTIAEEAEFDEDTVLAGIRGLESGGSASESFTFDEAGTYQVICTIPGHFTAGMEGTLTVE